MKVSVILVIYEGKKYIKPAFDAVFKQTHQDLEVIAVINKSTDGAKEEIQNNYPQVKIIDPGENLFFAKGNNVGIAAASGEYIQLVNQDVILEPNYVQEILKVFSDSQVAAATGKILRYDFQSNKKTNIVDTLGIVMNRSGRARDIGQLQEDHGQFEKAAQVFGVSGAVPMYRKSALEKVKYPVLPAPVRSSDRTPSPARGEGQFEENHFEYFDEDFGSYWEDSDLFFRLNTAWF